MITAVEATARDEAEVTIAVPQVYKDYLAPRHQFYDLKMLAVHLPFLCILYALWKWGGMKNAYHELLVFVIVYAPAPVLSFFMWRRFEKWQYVINEKQFRLIEWQYNGRLWQWHGLNWTREVVSSVEEGDWRGLPALYVRTAPKDPKAALTLVMVYAHDDRDKVVTQVLPLIEHFRGRFRHQFWYDQLRS